VTPFEPVHLLGWAIPFAWLGLGVLLLAAVAEGVYLRAKRRFDARDAATDVAMYVGNFAILLLWTPLLFQLYDRVHEHAFFDLGRESTLAARGWWLPWLLLFFAEDLCFYAFHRASHRVRFLWASHENHHSSTSFTWFVALRQTWTPFFAAVFWLPLLLLGFEPLMVLAAQSASLVFQSFLHTELVGTLPPLGLVFNTPGHHRAHHGADAECLDKNFGGVLIVWDRLFGSFHAGAPTRYGTDDPVRHNPVRVAFHGFVAIARDVAHSRSAREAFLQIFGPPSSSPIGQPKGTP
jgi:sterol desaturase/sphingolipid hydroxylase (fatty acid hydroxylase superfamily)